MPLSIEALQRPPLADVEIDFFANATKVGLKPESRGRVGEIVRNITLGGPQKITSQFIVITQPVSISMYYRPER